MPEDRLFEMREAVLPRLWQPRRAGAGRRTRLRALLLRSRAGGAETVAAVRPPLSTSVGIAADRQLLRDVQSHRHSHRRRPGSQHCCTSTAHCPYGTMRLSARLLRPIRAAESAPGRGHCNDAPILSPHRFVGGAQTPGALVVRRDVYTHRVPTDPGGGSVTFVGPHGHCYLDDPVAREEDDTPATVESIHAGIVFVHKDSVDAVPSRPSKNDCGGSRARRSRVRESRCSATIGWHGHRVVADPARSALAAPQLRGRRLNDLFGFQALGGCSAPAPTETGRSPSTPPGHFSTTNPPAATTGSSRATRG